ncbi:hypothetical protein TWF506_001100 [Arthrobotrys conoides]|uniref:Uncharacterized protein n=1 Tax=Arthrobotrys conoides TaxID=74498 RepID=A0AAN8PRL9_9PEZI
MVLVTYISSLFLGINIAYSLPVPPNDLPKSFVGRPGTKIQSTSKPTIGPPETSTSDQDITGIYGTAETISIPSVSEEKNGLGWVGGVAGPRLDTFATFRPTIPQDDSIQLYQPISLNKQQFKGANFQQESNIGRLKTALDDDEEPKDSDAEELAYTLGPNIDYDFSDGGDPTARFKLAPQDQGLELDFSDAERSGIDIDKEESEEEEKEPDYDPVGDPFYSDYSRNSLLRYKLRELLEEPLYKPLPSWKGKLEDLVINKKDSSATARRKMRHNLQSIPEGPSLLELEMQSTVRGGEALPHLRYRLGTLKTKFLPQGRESLQLPSPGLNPSSRVASINNVSSNIEERQDTQTNTLTLPEIASSFRPPKKNVPKLQFEVNGQTPGL